MGRGDFSRPDIGRLKPTLPQEITPKISSITITKLNKKTLSTNGVVGKLFKSEYHCGMV